ncbi:bifunctional UDP-sugar hydrolase/5'-nucleotidase [Gorillibacterium sp. CAU 1737]|uniref:bifunctional metallophosphatase/5'-nucleotidase n=1 Tax=Gorillibacterium sp. CAU 1737 TaxID=3140362 RepID=UPI0032617E58
MRETSRLVVLHMNDVHSHFEQLPRIASMLEHIRTESSSTAPVLTFDCGDHMDRVSELTEGTRGEANVDLMNHLKVDAAIPGNNEGLTLSLSDLDRAYERARFPILCANLLRRETGQPPSWMKPYVILQAGGLKVGVVGVTVPYIDFYVQLGWTVIDPIEAVAALVTEVRAQADILIVLSHLGLEQDRRLARAVPGIDVLLGGHTHHLLEVPEQVNGALICGAGKYGTHLGRVDLVYDHDKQRVVEVCGCCLPVEKGEESPAIHQAIARWRDRSKANLERPITRLLAPLTAAPCGETPLADSLADAILRHTGAELALVNSGQLVGGLAAGVVTEGMLHRICPSSIHACTLSITGADLLQALEDSLQPGQCTRTMSGYGFRGKELGGLCFSKMKVWYSEQVSDSTGSRILRAEVNGVPLDPARDYDVGTVSLFVFASLYPSLARGQNVRFHLPLLLRELLAMELKRNIPAADAWESRWITV